MIKQPPHSADAEAAVLGALMLDPRAFSRVAEWLSAEDFFVRKHQTLFSVIADMHRRGDPVDMLTVGEALERDGIAEDAGGIAYIVSLHKAAPSSANITAYAEIVGEKAQLRRAIEIGSQMANEAFDSRASSADVIARASHALAAVQTTRLRVGFQPAREFIRPWYSDFQARYESGDRMRGIPTPWRKLNDLTRGLRPALYVVGARPSMGKSVFAGQLAFFTAMRGDRAALFSIEQSAEECIQRATSCIAQVPHEWLDSPSPTPESDAYWPPLTATIADIVKAPLIIDETPAINITQVMARARREHQREPLKLIVADHLHDMGHDGAEELRVKIGRAVQGFKTLAKELRCPVVLMAQLSRNVAGRSDKRPVMTDLRESGEIEQKADVILFLHREDYYDKDSYMRGTVELIPAKGRNLRLDETILLENRFDQMRLDDWRGPWPTKPPEQQKAKPRGMR